MRVLVAYASKHGATRGIAERIGTQIQSAAVEVVMLDLGQHAAAPSADAVIVGSAVYMGRWMKEATEFVRANLATLSARPLWLFSSGPVGPRPLPEAKEIAEFRGISSFRDHRAFAGALDLRSLSLAERVIVKTVKAPEGDFRAWDDIDSWARTISGQLRSAVTSDSPSAVGAPPQPGRPR